MPPVVLTQSIDISEMTPVRDQYNGPGQRVLKIGPDALVPSTQQQYVYDEAGHLIGEYDAAGALIQETVYLGDMPVAVLTQSIDTSSATPVTSTNVYYIYTDQINTPRVITQASDNQIVWRWDAADPFGMLPPDEDPSGLGAFTYNLRFPGQLYDRETNLHYNTFRDYDPQQGRYVESDPIGLSGGLNSYSYVGANPNTFVDIDGLMKLPGNPSGLPSDWVRDPSHRDPNGERWRHPSGEYLDWAPAQPGKPGWRGRDHWHHNNGDDHLQPGDEVPDPQPKTNANAATMCEGNCKKVLKSVRNAITGLLVLTIMIVCAPVGL